MVLACVGPWLRVALCGCGISVVWQASKLHTVSCVSKVGSDLPRFLATLPCRPYCRKSLYLPIVGRARRCILHAGIAPRTGNVYITVHVVWAWSGVPYVNIERPNCCCEIRWGLPWWRWQADTPLGWQQSSCLTHGGWVGASLLHLQAVSGPLLK